jgi:hypothetical protein
LSDGLTDQQRQEVEAVGRVLKGEHPDDVARDLGLSPAVLSRTADELIRPEVLKPCIERMAVDYGFVGQMEFPFSLGIGTKAYRPDCVWFAGEVSLGTVAAIFEIEVGTSPKHRAGGVAFANFIALHRQNRIRFFAITPKKHRVVMENTVQLFAENLAEKWRLDAVVIPSFSPAVIRQMVGAAFSG